MSVHSELPNPQSSHPALTTSDHYGEQGQGMALQTGSKKIHLFMTLCTSRERISQPCSHCKGSRTSRPEHIYHPCHKQSFLFFFFFFEMEFSLLSPRLECNGMVSAHHDLCPTGSSDSRASASKVAGTMGACYHTQFIFVFLVETGFHHCPDWS